MTEELIQSEEKQFMTDDIKKLLRDMRKLSMLLMSNNRYLSLLNISFLQTQGQYRHWKG